MVWLAARATRYPPSPPGVKAGPGTGATSNGRYRRIDSEHAQEQGVWCLIDEIGIGAKGVPVEKECHILANARPGLSRQTEGKPARAAATSSSQERSPVTFPEPDEEDQSQRWLDGDGDAEYDAGRPAMAA